MTGLEWPRRRPLRLPGYDSTQAGACFVALGVWHRECLLGHIVVGEMALPPFGETVSTKKINLLRDTPGAVFWQRNDYKPITRNERDLEMIRRYIQRNPARWEWDTQNPERLCRPVR